MGFVYESKELKATINGKEYSFREPSALKQKEMSKRFREATADQDAVDLYIDFFKDLGLPEDVLNEMTLTGLLDLFSYTVGAKKN